MLDEIKNGKIDKTENDKIYSLKDALETLS